MLLELPMHNGGNDFFCTRLGILTIFKIAFFVYGNRNYNSIGPQKCISFHPSSCDICIGGGLSVKVALNLPAHFS
jgi:hypothetical protein